MWVFRLVGCLVGFAVVMVFGSVGICVGSGLVVLLLFATMLFGFTGGDVVQFLGLCVVGVYLRAGLWVCAG